MLFGFAAAFCLSMVAKAEMWDVLEFTLSEKCTVEKYLKIVDDFDQYYKDKGYQAEILLPLHTENQAPILWIGRTKNSEDFDKAYDHWLAGQAQDGSAVDKLSERFADCGTTTSRSSFITAR
ncbi:MAG: hypothetical protein E2O71_12080 [Deltaproteobacteria bacterium]|nr:MAG: hypothetical protein E2O71_12080 [Deltaproteobacteria bacterium]